MLHRAHLALAALLAIACAADPPPPEPGVHVVNPEEASYLVDATTHSCFLLHKAHSLPVSCYELKENNPKAAKAITWIQPPAPREAPLSPPQADTRPSKSREAYEEFKAGVKQLNDVTYEVQRSAVEKVLENPTRFARGARIVPSIKNGKPVGFKLYAIRPTSPYAVLGLNNGDTINSINGEPLTTPDRALEVYTKIREASELRVALTRRGKPIELVYKIAR